MKSIQAHTESNFHLFDFSLLEEVCLIDDEPAYIFLNRMILNDAFPNIKITSFNNIKSGFSHLQAQKCVSCLAILDINIGITTGFELLDKLSPSNFKNLKVIIHSSCSSNNNIEKAFSYPIVKAFIEKPLFMETIDLISGKIAPHKNNLDFGGAIFTRETYANRNSSKLL